jgi:hypothetical protein
VLARLIDTGRLIDIGIVPKDPVIGNPVMSSKLNGMSWDTSTPEQKEALRLANLQESVCRSALKGSRGSAGSSSDKKVNWNAQKDCLDDDGRKYKVIVLNNEGNGKTYRLE